jgi:hypothetical protein
MKINEFLDTTRQFFGQQQESMKGKLNGQLIEKIDAPLTKLNGYLVPVCAVLILILSIYAANKLSAPGMMFGGLVLVLFIFFADYIAQKFIVSCKAAITANETTLSSTAVLDLLVYTTIFVAIGFLLGALYGLISGGSFSMFLFLLGVAVIFAISVVPLHEPDSINLKIKADSTVAEDLIAISSIGVKSGLYFSTLLSKVFTVFGAAAILYGFIAAIFSSNPYGGQEHLLTSLAGIVTLFVGLLWPIIAYFSFLFIFFIYDIVLAILSLKHKRF